MPASGPEQVVVAVTDAPERKQSPEMRSNLLSQATLQWATPFFKLTLKLSKQGSALGENELYLLPDEDRAEKAAERFNAGWADAEAALRKKAGLCVDAPLESSQREKIFNKAAVRVLGRRFTRVAPVVKALNSSAQFLYPVLMAGILQYIEGTAPLGLPSTPSTGFGLVIALGAVTMLKAVMENLYFFTVARAGWQLRSAVATAVFQKSLRLSAAARQQKTLGEFVNMMRHLRAARRAAEGRRTRAAEAGARRGSLPLPRADRRRRRVARLRPSAATGAT